MATVEGAFARTTEKADDVTTALRTRTAGQILADYLTTTDHKKIGTLYLVSSFFFFIVAGAMALVIRAELFAPGLQVVESKE